MTKPHSFVSKPSSRAREGSFKDKSKEESIELKPIEGGESTWSSAGGTVEEEYDGEIDRDQEDEVAIVPTLEPVKTDINTAGFLEVKETPSTGPTLDLKRPRGRPRKHPKPNPEGQAKVAKGRSKTGCITCRKRKKKCDEAKPSCMKCEKSSIQCEGYAVRTIWKTGKERGAEEGMLVINYTAKSGEGKNIQETTPTSKELAQRTTQLRQNLPLWVLYHSCCGLLAKISTIMEACPGKLSTKSERMLRGSSERLFLWGESFTSSDLDILIKWSNDVHTSVVEFLLDISKALMGGIFPILPTYTTSKRILQLAAIVSTIVRESKEEDEEGLQTRRNDGSEGEEKDEGDEDDEDDEDDDEDDDDRKEGENAEEAILDIHTSVECLLDLVPLMEQILERSASEIKNSVAVGLD